jgi:hypothetical protein
MEVHVGMFARSKRVWFQLHEKVRKTGQKWLFWAVLRQFKAHNQELTRGDIRLPFVFFFAPAFGEGFWVREPGRLSRF